ncbi:sodium-translocating pyrophosphatase [Chloroflexia bacterium SDU3-3]|nr:sodium-translocating pyrophosphatase [Chloroflexia bacterium SDU3-3]
MLGLNGLNGLSSFEQSAVWAVLAISILGIAYAFLLRSQILQQDKGTPRMQEVWGFIKQGANAYLSRQFRTISILIVVLTVVLGASVAIIPPTREAEELFGAGATMAVAIGRALAFLMGSLFSYAVGFVGMNVAVEANVRVAAAARKGYNAAMQVAYRSGTVTGMLTVGLGLLGGTLIFLFFGIAAPDALLGFGFGGSLIALFMRVGGGIYTKAADVGADLVGKVEAGIPEDDPRNAAVIADLVGDNVGDCAGMAADVFESFEVTIVSALILGLVLGDAALGSMFDGQYDMRFVIFPLILRGIGVVASVIGNMVVRTDDRRRNAMAAMNRGFYLAAIVAVIGFAVVSFFYMQGDWRPFLATITGILLAIVLDKVTEYFTSTHFSPVKDIAKASQTGSATNILGGLSLGLESSVWAVVVIAISILASVLIYGGIADPTLQFTSILYGVSLTGIGMLTLTGNTISMDSFGPISDNANGIGEMSGLDKNARNVMDDLDAVGNTTKAVTKGIAIGSAVIAAVALFGSFLTDTGKVQQQLIEQGVAGVTVLSGINVASPLVFIGLLIGGAVPFLFSSLTIRAVARAAGQIVNEVRRQFRIPGVMEGNVLPDYARAVAISTTAAQKELISLGLIAVLVPILVGFLLGVEALGGFLAGIILAGQLMAVFQSNAGGAWDNAKKYIEDGNYGGKHSEPHKAAVVGDTVGDPLKDTAGPALNPMIKVINLVSLIIAPIIVNVVRPGQGLGAGVIVGMVLCTLALAWAIWQSKRDTPEAAIETATPAPRGAAD